jgi:hypothetical protein
VVPYLKDITALAFRSPQLIVINAKTGIITYTELYDSTTSGDYSSTTINITKANELRAERDAKVVLYFEHLHGQPFYFDHKLADSASWKERLWMFRGFHINPKNKGLPLPGTARTNFIEGCDHDDDIVLDEDSYYCPMPPYAYSNRVKSHNAMDDLLYSHEEGRWVHRGLF